MHQFFFIYDQDFYLMSKDNGKALMFVFIFTSMEKKGEMFLVYFRTYL
jgi:hypothetical protein